MPKPVFEVVPGFVCLTIRFKNPLAPYLNGRENEGINEGVNEGVNDMDAALKQVYSIIKTTPGIKTNQISDKIGRSTATVERYLSALKKKDLIEHRGSAKAGLFSTIPAFEFLYNGTRSSIKPYFLQYNPLQNRVRFAC